MLGVLLAFLFLNREPVHAVLVWAAPLGFLPGLGYVWRAVAGRRAGARARSTLELGELLPTAAVGRDGESLARLRDLWRIAEQPDEPRDLMRLGARGSRASAMAGGGAVLSRPGRRAAGSSPARAAGLAACLDAFQTGGERIPSRTSRRARDDESGLLGRAHSRRLCASRRQVHGIDSASGSGPQPTVLGLAHCPDPASEPAVFWHRWRLEPPCWRWTMRAWQAAPIQRAIRRDAVDPRSGWTLCWDWLCSSRRAVTGFRRWRARVAGGPPLGALVPGT